MLVKLVGIHNVTQHVLRFENRECLADNVAAIPVATDGCDTPTPGQHGVGCDFPEQDESAWRDDGAWSTTAKMFVVSWDSGSSAVGLYGVPRADRVDVFYKWILRDGQPQDSLHPVLLAQEAVSVEFSSAPCARRRDSAAPKLLILRSSGADLQLELRDAHRPWSFSRELSDAVARAIPLLEIARDWRDPEAKVVGRDVLDVLAEVADRQSDAAPHGTPRMPYLRPIVIGAVPFDQSSWWPEYSPSPPSPAAGIMESVLRIAGVAAFALPQGALISAAVSVFEAVFKHASPPQEKGNLVTDVSTKVLNDLTRTIANDEVQRHLAPARDAFAFLDPFYQETWSDRPVVTAGTKKSSILAPLCGDNWERGEIGPGSYIQRVLDAQSELSTGAYATPTSYAVPPPFRVVAAPAWAYVASSYLLLNKIAAVVMAYPEDEGGVAFAAVTADEMMRASYKRRGEFITNMLQRIPAFISTARSIQAAARRGIAERLLQLEDKKVYNIDQGAWDPCSTVFEAFSVVDHGLEKDTSRKTLDPDTRYSSSIQRLGTDEFRVSSHYLDMGFSTGTEPFDSQTAYREKTRAMAISHGRSWLIHTANRYRALWSYDQILGPQGLDALVATWTMMLKNYCRYVPEEHIPPACIPYLSE